MADVHLPSSGGPNGREPQPSPQSRYRRIPDLMGYYRLRYPGVTRGKLQQIDPALYQRLRKANLLFGVPKMAWPGRESPLAEYRKRYQGLTRSQLQAVDRGLYGRLRIGGLLRHVPTVRGIAQGHR